ncbi:MAG: NUDIX domain-containing protein [Anaerolineae bacterium]|jgi:8-oxo-dGTP pyrophosphatase MutT (NUDIX family)
MTIGRFCGGIGALIWSPADEYLILKRSAEKDFAAGSWECVTGRVDQGEGFEDALYREVREELGVEVQVEFIIGTTHFYRGAAHPENELIGVVYGCTLADPAAIRLSPEHSECRWVSAREVKALLSAEDATEQWLWRVVERAEAVRGLLPAALRDYYQETGFELY